MLIVCCLQSPYWSCDWYAPDAEKQSAIDAFLGIEKGISTPQARKLIKRGYRDWFDPAHLEDPVSLPEAERRIRLTISQGSDYYIEYYRPKLFTVLERHFAMRINSSKWVEVVASSQSLHPLSGCFVWIGSSVVQ